MCIKKQISLKIILAISITGLLFSGYLSFFEVIMKRCALGGGCGTLLGLPVCLYGFAMYLIIFIITILGLKAKN